MSDTRFKLGNPGGPGAPKKLKTQVKDFIKKYPLAVEELMVVIYEMGIEGDLEACKYFIDRIKGKPKAIMGIDEADKELLTVATVLAFRKMVDTNLLEEGSIEIVEDGTEST